MIPDYQTLMRPLLECIQDGQEHLFKNVIEQLADRFDNACGFAHTSGFMAGKYVTGFKETKEA